MNNTAFNAWVHEQLEPDERMPSAGRRQPIENCLGHIPEQRLADIIKDLQWEEEENRKQDEYLAKYGII